MDSVSLNSGIVMDQSHHNSKDNEIYSQFMMAKCMLVKHGNSQQHFYVMICDQTHHKHYHRYEL